VSFMDRLLECIRDKLKKKFGLQLSVVEGIRQYDDFMEKIDMGKSIIKRFKDNFFIAKLMDESNKVEKFLGVQEESKEETKQAKEEVKYNENSEEAQKMS